VHRFVILVAFTALCAAQLISCSPVRFNTELSNADSLVPGDPVTNLGAKIGSVASVSPLPDGNSRVEFEVDHSAARLVLQDSIMLLHPGKSSSLELLNTNPISLRAPAGAMIEGAANEQEADLLVASRMPGFSAGLAAVAGATGALAAVAPGAVTGPAANALQQQLNAIQNWYAVNGARNAAALAQQLQQINQSAAALERQLINQGRSAQAQQLRNQIDQLARILSGAPPKSSSNTLVTPPVP
jgi:hypothetical protein